MELITELLLLLIVFLLSTLIRLVPYLRYQYPGGSDIFFHLNKIRDVNYPHDAEIPEMKYYPSWMHLFYQKVSNKFRFFSDVSVIRIHAIWDVFNALLFWVIARNLLPTDMVLYSISFFLFTPMLIKTAETFSPRPVGHLWYNFSILTGFLEWPFCLISAIGVVLVARSHKLSFQTIIFVFLILGIFFNPIFLLNIVLGLLLGLIIYRDHFYNSIKSHYTFILRHVKGSRFPNKHLLPLAIVPQIVPAILVAVVLILQINFNLLLEFQITFIEYSNGEIIKLFALFCSIWLLAVLFLVLFYPFGSAFRYGALASLPSSILLGFILSFLELEVFVIPVLAIEIIIALYLQRNTPSNESLMVIAKYIASNINEPVLCGTSARRVIDYYTKHTNKTIPSAEIPSDHFYAIIEEEGFRYFLIPSKITLTNTQELLVIEDWKLVTSSL